MKTFYNFLKNKKISLVQEQGVIGGPFVDGALEGLGINNKMRDAGKALGQGTRNTIVGVKDAIEKRVKDGEGVKGAAIGAMDAISKGAMDTTTGLGKAIFGQNADDQKDIKRKYLELQTALVDYSNAIKNSPSLKQTKQGQEISDSIQKALQEIEDSIAATHNMYQQSEKRIRPLNPNIPIPQRGVIRPD